LTLADFIAFALAETGPSPGLLWLNAAVPLACVAMAAAVLVTRTWGEEAKGNAQTRGA